MPTFRYRALARSGEVLEGETSATDQRAVVEQLRQAGHLPLAVDAKRGGPRWRGGLTLGSRRAGTERRGLLALTRQLSTMLGAGVALDEALEIVAEVTEPGGATRLAAELRERLARGKSFADALELSGPVVPPWYVGMIRAGETSGALPLMLSRLADFMERAEATATELRSMLVYPAILLVTTLGAMTIFVTLVLPRFKAMFEQAGVRLPWATELLANLADIVAANAPWLLLLVAVAAVALPRLLGPERSRSLRLSFLDRLPIVSTLARRIEAARAARTLAVLLSNGVPLLQAIAVIRGGTRLPSTGAALDHVVTRLREGGSLATGLAGSPVFPPMAVRLLGIGERSGRLAEMFDRVAEDLERDTNETVKRAMAALVPLLTIFSGVVIALVMGSILTALLSVNDLTR